MERDVQSTLRRREFLRLAGASLLTALGPVFVGRTHADAQAIAAPGGSCSGAGAQNVCDPQTGPKSCTATATNTCQLGATNACIQSTQKTCNGNAGTAANSCDSGAENSCGQSGLVNTCTGTTVGPGNICLASGTFNICYRAGMGTNLCVSPVGFLGNVCVTGATNTVY
jgi:hypothetical protein